MATTEPYCGVTDLIFGNIPVPESAPQYVAQAAEEIDSIIGLKYATPVVASDNAEQRPVRLLLKKLNIWLATGRCILAIAGAGEDDQNHAYGLYLVEQALAALQSISDGSVVLPGIDPATPTTNQSSGPMIHNEDSYSAVEGFRHTYGDPARQAIHNARHPVLPPYYPVYRDPTYRGW